MQNKLINTLIQSVLLFRATQKTQLDLAVT